AQCIRTSSSKLSSGSLCQKVGVKSALDWAFCARVAVVCAGMMKDRETRRQRTILYKLTLILRSALAPSMVGWDGMQSPLFGSYAGLNFGCERQIQDQRGMASV